ncbi:hypothetical protein [Bradyrhizobium sp. 2TAF24]
MIVGPLESRDPPLSPLIARAPLRITLATFALPPIRRFARLEQITSGS